jgi:hypothetical protein
MARSTRQLLHDLSNELGISQGRIEIALFKLKKENTESPLISELITGLEKALIANNRMVEIIRDEREELQKAQ